MNVNALLSWLVYSTMWLTVGCLLMALLLSVTQLRQWRLHRCVWAAVLLQGLIAGWFTVPVAVKQPGTALAVSGQGPSMLERLAARSDATPRKKTQTSRDANASLLPVAEPQTPLHLNWQMWLLGAWAAGVCGYWAVTSIRYVRWVRALRHSARPLPQPWQAEWQRVLSAHEYRGTIPIEGHETEGPLVTWLPGGTRLIVPHAYWLSRMPGERRAILEHEAGHVIRHDLIKSVAVRVAASLHWFNPAAWYCVRRWEEAAEWACDEQLALRDPHLTTVLARVLLDLVHVSPSRLGVSAARGARLSFRLRRLIALRSRTKESTMKKWFIGITAAALLIGSAVQFKLVARQIGEDEEAGERRERVEWQQRLHAFGEKLSSQDELAAQLAKQLGKPAAAIAVRDRVAGLAEQHRRQMRREAIPNYFAEHFDGPNGKLNWRDGQDEYRAKFLKACNTFDTDMASIHEALSALADELADETELEKLAKRLLQHSEAPVVLYVEHVQRELRPNGDFVLRELGELFAADEDYHYFVRASRREEAGRFVKRAMQFAGLVPDLKAELKVYAGEFSDQKPLDKKLKAAFQDPLFPSFVATVMMRDFEGDPQEAYNGFFEQIGHMAVDTGSGLSVLEEDAQRELQEVMEHFARAQRGVAALKGPLQQFTSRIRDKEPLEKQWKEFLQTQPALVFLAGQFELPPMDAGEAVRGMLAPALRKGEDGKVHLAAPEGEEEGELMEHLREIFRNYRMLRVQTRPIEKLATGIDDPETAKALQSLAGKVLVMQEIEHAIKTAPSDVWDEWLRERFEEGDGGWVVRPQAHEEIQGLLHDIEAIEAESAKDDF